MNESGKYNHPHEPVRHSYPVAIADAGFGTAARLLAQTAPFVVARLAILVAVSVVTVVWCVVTFGGAAFLTEKVHPWMGYGWFIAGCGAYGWVWWFFARYALYLLKCGHIAVLTELITTGSLNNRGASMFAYGKQVVTDRFPEVNVLFVVDSLVHGVVMAFNRTLDFVTGLLPIPGLRSVARLAGGLIHAATTYIDETIFSYNLARGEDNPWRGGRDGLIYYCQNYKEILKTAVLCVIADFVLTGLAWIALMAPVGLLAVTMPVLAGWSFIIALLLAINCREAVLKPLFLILIMIKFHVSVRGQSIDEGWDAKLHGISSKFGRLKEKIAPGITL